MTSEVFYVVAGPEYWDSLPQTREFRCARTRIVDSRAALTKGASVYANKQDAANDALATRRSLYRETQYGGKWRYQHLLTPPE